MAYIEQSHTQIFGGSVDMAATLALLAEAEAAYHDLATGKAVTKFKDQNGEEVSYSQASASRLLAYINDLKRQLGQLPGSGPMQVWF